MTEERRRMPEPWFRANAASFPISEILSNQVYRLARDGERQLGPYVLPPFQRGFVWSQEQQIKLIESIWGGLPIGAYVYNDAGYEHECDGWLLDGQQRLTSIILYATGAFRVFGYSFQQLPLVEQRGFRMRPIGVMTTRIQDPKICADVYDRLAYGGTAHPDRDPPSRRGGGSDAA